MKYLTAALIAAVSAAIVPQNTSTVPTIGSATAPAAARAIPFGVGEKMEYEASWSGVPMGTGVLEVTKVESIRGRAAWNVQMRIKGGIPLVYRVNSVFESWMDTLSLHSLRYASDQHEGGKNRQRHFEIFPERSMFRQRITPDTLKEEQSVAEPLDEASFLYFIRTTPLEVGKTYTYERYFRPDRNPVTIKVLRKERIRVPAGSIDAIVIEPNIKTRGIFADGGEARVWISDDASRVLLRMDSKLAIGTLHLSLTKYTPPKR